MSGDVGWLVRGRMSSPGALSTNFAQSYQVIGTLQTDERLTMRASLTPGALGDFTVLIFNLYSNTILTYEVYSLLILHLSYRIILFKLTKLYLNLFSLLFRQFFSMGSISLHLQLLSTTQY